MTNTMPQERGGLLPVGQMTDDELIFRITDALRRRRLSGWFMTFAISIAGRAKRPGWTPTSKQVGAMQRLVQELRSHNPYDDGEVELLDRDDTIAIWEAEKANAPP